MLRVGFNVGFNSKNSFIRAFKELTKLTPTEYRKKYKP
ncbi:helix-turn-helix domain-containing protein [Leptospira montravelensis]|nr:helix-turn-helix domain-containing protein [Leptospira montravelensis]